MSIARRSAAVTALKKAHVVAEHRRSNVAVDTSLVLATTSRDVLWCLSRRPTRADFVIAACQDEVAAHNGVSVTVLP
jgi:hypothetical protein